MEKVEGIGGFFFRAKDPKALAAWYETHLGVGLVPDAPEQIPWVQARGPTVFAPFAADTDYFNPSQKQFMQNFRVEDLDSLILKLKEEGVTLVGEPETYDYGKFGWILDPEGNKIELWQPNDKAFL